MLKCEATPTGDEGGLGRFQDPQGLAEGPVMLQCKLGEGEAKLRQLLFNVGGFRGGTSWGIGPKRKLEFIGLGRRLFAQPNCPPWLKKEWGKIMSRNTLFITLAAVVAVLIIVALFANRQGGLELSEPDKGGSPAETAPQPQRQ